MRWSYYLRAIFLHKEDFFSLFICFINKVKYIHFLSVRILV